MVESFKSVLFNICFKQTRIGAWTQIKTYLGTLVFRIFQTFKLKYCKNNWMYYICYERFYNMTNEALIWSSSLQMLFTFWENSPLCQKSVFIAWNYFWFPVTKMTNREKVRKLPSQAQDKNRQVRTRLNKKYQAKTW